MHALHITGCLASRKDNFCYEPVSIKNMDTRISHGHGSLCDCSADLHFADQCQPALSMVAYPTGTDSSDSHPLRHESIHALL